MNPPFDAHSTRRSAPAYAAFRRGLAVTAPALGLGLLGAAESRAFEVVATSPTGNGLAPVSTAISVTFDEPVDLGTADAASFRVFGRRTGPLGGTFVLGEGGRTVTLVPDRALGHGEGVVVNLSHDLSSVGGTPLRAAGYTFGFRTEVRPSSGNFIELDVMSNRTDGNPTRIYGAAAMDWNGDGYTDLATINEVSADVRVTLNRADGSGLFHPFLPAHPIGVEASPNEPADFDNDGVADLCVAAISTADVWVLRGNGDGTFTTTQSIPVGLRPHGIQPIDVDGDGDPDIVNANELTNSLSMMINDGSGVFGAPIFFEGGVDGEYGLAAADMNDDGIGDLVVSGVNGSEINTLLGNGDGTFTPTVGGSQPSGGRTWVVVVDDVDGDGSLDVSTANSTSNTASILLGLGNGRFGTPTTVNMGGHTVSTDLGDVDGDGDADWMISSFGARIWRLYRNDGAGGFTFAQEFDAAENPSCGFFLDIDNDGDLDAGLSDEVADVITLVRNQGPASSVDPEGDANGDPAGPGVDAGGAANDRDLGPCNSPNPFVGETTIGWQSPAPGPVLIEIFDLSGRRVAMRSIEARAGRNEITFVARDEAGATLSGGVYVYTIRETSRVQAGRMTVLR